MFAKQLIEQFYGRPAEYSYWSGCSQGGRQGLMLAQKYPDAYDGIAAAAPAINWAQFIPAASWAQVVMSITGQYPRKCEVDALTDAAVSACDPLDGVTDGLISDESQCAFDPFTLVGKTTHCPSTNTTMIISEAAATIANLTWTGPRKVNGDFLWHGVGHQARLTGADAPAGTTSDLGYASTSCTANGTCTGVSTGLGEEWLRLFVKKDAKWSFRDIANVEEYVRLFQAGVQEYNSIIGTADADLSLFRDAGGKLLTYHGLVSTPPASPTPIDNTDSPSTRQMALSPQREQKTTMPASIAPPQTLRLSSATFQSPAWHIALVAPGGSQRQRFKR